MSTRTEGPSLDAVLAREFGIHRVMLEVPFSTGSVNAWLIEADDLTLVDAGTNTASNLMILKQTLERLGHQISDISTVVLTHHDIDHIGLAGPLQQICGKLNVVAPAGQVEFLSDFRPRHMVELEYIDSVLEKEGVPWDLRGLQRRQGELEGGFGSRVRVTRPVHDGDQLVFAGRSWRAHYRPGHSPFDTCFEAEGLGLMITGDHLLEHSPANTYVTGLADDIRAADPALGFTLAPLQLKSLQATADTAFDLALPGHGSAFAAGPEIAASNLRRAERGIEQTLEQARGRDISAYEICLERWGKDIVNDMPQRVSRILGELEILVGRGQLDCRKDGVHRYG